MSFSTCIAMSYGGAPLRRNVVGAAKKVIYLSNEPAEQTDIEKIVSVGFPREFVFQNDEALYKQLEDAAAAGNREELDRLWSEARPWK